MAFNLTLEQSLIFAAHAHGVASAKNALEKGVDINSRDPFGHTALYWAAEAGDLQLVKFLVEHGANLNASDEANKHTAVTIAVDKKNMAIAEFLIESGADVNIGRTFRQKTCLDMALERKDMKLAKLLIDHGADINTKNQLGDTLLAITLQAKDYDLAQFLVDNGADINVVAGMHIPFFSALQDKDVKFIQFFLDNGINLKQKQIGGDTLLHNAAHKLWALEMIVSSGLEFDINIKNNFGDTPLHRAMGGGWVNYDIIKLLLENGADVNCLDARDRTPLYMALEDQDTKLVNLFLSYLPDINTPIKYGNTVLHAAARYCSPEMVKLLIKNGADLESKNIKGLTPIYLAITRNKPEVIKVLMDAGSELDDESKLLSVVEYRMTNPRSSDRQTNTEEYRQIVKILKEKGVDVTNIDFDFYPPQDGNEEYDLPLVTPLSSEAEHNQ